MHNNMHVYVDVVRRFMCAYAQKHVDVDVVNRFMCICTEACVCGCCMWCTGPCAYAQKHVYVACLSFLLCAFHNYV